MLTAGAQDQRITVQRSTRVEDTQGGGSRTWAAVTGLVNIPARVQPISDGAELRQADQVTATQRWRVTLRYGATAAAVTPKDRIVWGSRTLQIEAARPGGAKCREWIEVTASERTA